ncbi:ChaN family lipoprotein [Nitrosococcus wardiae]|uniref:PDZ domain-containing protein n=1 Tax=Nitrosococcus wardiae TaxID=1814290 RepID=A0A4P7BYH8_9GAMM|nr:ChaN family lipoprotein [Nitrosococcus wardiae]QBQ55121.1 PDZ domain-containing protein [Nitrosococcus wardiae]
MQNQATTPIFLLLLFIVLFPALVQSSPRESAPEGAVQGEVKEREVVPDTTKIEPSTKAVNLRQLLELEGLIPELSRYQVVFVGEQHPRYDHHLNQLAIIRGLHAIHPELVIGVEFFQQPFQPYLDQYIAGELSVGEFLDKTEYYDRWIYDFRLYAPILEFAQENDIPILALNVPTELIQKVGRDGLEGLSKEERGQLPADIDRSNAEYRQRLKKVFENHPQHFGTFETFYEAQLVWDESMAEGATHYLQDHPDTHMVVLAGNGHLAYGVGIPERFSRRLDKVSVAIVLNDWEGLIEPEIADYLLLSEKKELPNAGFLGVMLKQSDGKLKIQAFSETSAAKTAGIKEKDELLALNGHPVVDMSDVKEIMWDKKPGDEVIVKVRRSAFFDEDKELEIKVELR